MRSRTAFESLNVVAVFANGIVGGIVAGTVFAVAQMVAAALRGQPFSTPLNSIAAIMLGPEVLSDGNLTPSVIAAAVVIHLALSAVYGIILAVLSMSVLAVGTSPAGAVVTGMVFGLILWLVNIFLIAPLAFPWFSAENQAVQLVLHVLFFGAPLGLYFGRTLTHSAEPGD